QQRPVAQDRPGRVAEGFELDLAADAERAADPSHEDAAPGIVHACSGCAARNRASGGRGGLDGFAVQRADLVGQLGAVLDPVLHAGGVDHHALLGALRHRVVVTHALDVAAVAGAARIGDDDVVEGALLRAAAGEADLDHGAVPVLPSRQDGEVSRQVYAMARVHGNPGGG